MKTIQFTELKGLSGEAKRVLRNYALKYNVRYLHELVDVLNHDPIFNEPSGVTAELQKVFSKYGYHVDFSPPPRRFYLSEASVYLDLPVKTIRNLVKENKIRYFIEKSGGLRFLQEDLDELKKKISNS